MPISFGLKMGCSSLETTAIQEFDESLLRKPKFDVDERLALAKTTLERRPCLGFGGRP